MKSSTSSTSTTTSSSSSSLQQSKVVNHHRGGIMWIRHHPSNIIILLIITIILSYTSTVTTAVYINHHNHHSNNNKQEEEKYTSTRYKQKYPCNTIIDTIHPSKTLSIIDTFLTNIAPESKPFLKSIFRNTLKYGVQIKVVCGGCHTTKAELKATYGFLSNQNKKVWDSYCEHRNNGEYGDVGEDGHDAVYGADYEHSGIVMIPMVENEDNRRGKLVPLDGTIAGFVHTHTTKVNRYDVPSQLWSDLEDGHWSTELLICFLATATKGVVSFAPDYMGYGYSLARKNYLVRKAYATSFLPLWVKVAGDLREETDCQTMLGDAAFVQGYGEGGYAAVAIADALSKALNVEIVQTRAGAGAFHLVETLVAQVINSEYDLLWDHMDSITLMSAAYSYTNPSVGNVNLGQSLLSSRFMDESNPDLNIMRWLDEEDITSDTITERIHDFAKSQGDEETNILYQLLDPSFVSYLRQASEENTTEPCTVSSTSSLTDKGFHEHEKLCEVLKENSLVDLIEKSRFPIHFCHSEEDELTTFDNIPDLESNHLRLSLTRQTGDHALAGGFCYSSDIMFLTSTTFRQYAPIPKHSDTCTRTSTNYGHGTTNACEDSTSPFDVIPKGKKKPVKKRCTWIKKKESQYRCGLPGVAEMCPRSCGKCQICADSTTKMKIWYNGRMKNKDCSWVRKKNTRGRCKIPGIESFCRKTCGGC